MLRKSFVALAAVAALITLTATEASARGGHGGGGHGGGFHGGGFSRGMGGAPRAYMGGGYRGFSNRGFVNRGYVNRGFGPRWGNRVFVHRPFVFRRHFGPRFRFYGYPYAYYGSYDSCYRWRRVWTPVGWRFRRFWVCGYPYY